MPYSSQFTFSSARKLAMHKRNVILKKNVYLQHYQAALMILNATDTEVASKHHQSRQQMVHTYGVMVLTLATKH